MRVSTEKLLFEIRELADELGHPPTQKEMVAFGEHAVKTYYDRFGSWNASLEAAGFESRTPGREQSVTDEELLEEIRRLAEELGHPPSLKEARAQGDYSVTTFYQRFGSWSESLEAAGFESREPQSEIPDEVLLAELEQLAEDLGEPPSISQMDEQGEYWGSTYQEHFGSWSTAMEEAGFEPPDTSRIEEADLLAELRRLADELGHRPRLVDMREEGRYGERTYYRRFGSWTAALEEAFEEDDEPDE